jgi:DNA-binding NtrC family response regulator
MAGRNEIAVRVLVIDDEPYVAELIRQLLASEGHEGVVAGSVEEADAVLLGGGVEAITLDVCMPGRRAIGWLEALAAARPALARRTLVISGSGPAPRDLERISRCGAGFLAKPFRVERFREAFRSQAVVR